MPSWPVRTTPCKRRRSANSASASLFITKQPPSAQVMFLLAWKLKLTRSPMAPMRCSFQCESMACAASSITRRPCFLAMAYSLPMSTGRPARYTGMMARVCGVMAASTASRSMLRVRGSISTKTGLAPTATTTLAVATQVTAVVMTSSPGPMPAMRKATSMVAVPLEKARTGRPPNSAESCASKASTFGPEVIQPEASTRPTSAMVSASMCGRVKGRKSGLTRKVFVSEVRAQERDMTSTPARISIMPAQRMGPRASPNSHHAANALTT